MLTSGFFESVGSDRVYDANSFNTFFEGLISPNGIFEGVGDAFSVLSNAEGGLKVNVTSGKAIVNNHWVKNDASVVIELDASHQIFNRWDMLTLRWDSTTRNVTLEKTTGTMSSAEPKPEPIRSTTQYEIVLAYIYIPAGSETISQGNITDCRYITELCGVIAGLIEQVSTTNLYRQYAAQFEDLKRQMSTWQKEQEEAYEAWFATLSSELTVNTTLTRTTANYLTTREDGTQYIDVPASLNYESGDILEVFINGIMLVEGADYDLTVNEVENVPMIYLYADVTPNNMLTFYCLKSVIGPSLVEISTLLDELLTTQQKYINP